jgi:hypothetical protein
MEELFMVIVTVFMMALAVVPLLTMPNPLK